MFDSACCKEKMPLYVGIALVGLLLLAGIVKFAVYQGSGGPDVSRFQGVFLTSGQVYFGKLHNVYGRYPYITNIYYLRADQNPQEGKEDGKQPQLSLVKLGNEIHGPEDRMYLNHAHILFWENLKTDSQVSKAITDAISAVPAATGVAQPSAPGATANPQ